MTTHDYPRDTNTSADFESTTPIADPEAERLVEPPTAHEASSPETTADPSWQRHADQFAANREQNGRADRHVDAQPSSETSLFADSELEDFRGQWSSVQAGFVDDPKRCVEQADGLVSAVVDQLSRGFADARSRLEQQWSRGEDASTEDLRLALKRYREFFDRLLAV